MPRHHDVFLSYSHADISVMQRIRDSLIASGIRVWTDEELEPGSPSWKKAIEIAIKEAGCIIVLLSPHVPESRWVGEELDFAEIHEKRPFPILISGDKKSSVPFGLSSSQWIDIRTEENYLPELDRLVKTLKNHLKIDTDDVAETSEEQIKEEQVTEQVYRQLRNYRAQKLSDQIEQAVKTGDFASAQKAQFEAERDYRVIEIDFELIRLNTREYFLKWMRILEYYHHDANNFAAGRNFQGIIDAGTEATRKFQALKDEFATSHKTIDVTALNDEFYWEALKLGSVDRST